jgi:hypothetical protein
MQDPSILYNQSSLEWEEYQNLQALSQEYGASTSADFKQLLEQGYCDLEATRQLLERTRARLSQVQSRKLETRSAVRVILSSRSFWIHLISLTFLLSGIAYVYNYSYQSHSRQAAPTSFQPN